MLIFATPFAAAADAMPPRCHAFAFAFFSLRYAADAYAASIAAAFFIRHFAAAACCLLRCATLRRLFYAIFDTLSSFAVFATPLIFAYVAAGAMLL